MQLPMTYSAPKEKEDLWTQQSRWIRNAVDLLGHKFVAGELDIGPSQLTDALKESERKYVKAKWVAKLLELAPEPLRREWNRITLDATGYEPELKLKRTLNAEEALSETNKRVAARFGEAGVELLSQIAAELNGAAR